MTPSEFTIEYEKLTERYYTGEITEKQYHTELMYMGVTKVNTDENYVVFDGKKLPGTPRYKYHMKIPKPIHSKLKSYAEEQGITLSQATSRAVLEFFK